MDAGFPPSPDTPPTPPRPDLAPPATPGFAPSDFATPASDSPRRSGTRAVAFFAVVAITIATLGGGLLAIQRLTAPDSDASHHGFLDVRMDGSPLRWNPCESIHYVINPDVAPPSSVDDVHEAIRQVSAATGIAFVYDGLTDEVPSRRRLAHQPTAYGDRWAPVLIAWVDPAESDISFERNGHEAAAVASPARPPTGEDVIVTGFVALNLQDPNPPGFAWPGAQGPVLLHELGHIMGLAHVPDQGEIMERSGGGVTAYGPGDLEGLRRLGRDGGCLTTPRPGGPSGA